MKQAPRAGKTGGQLRMRWLSILIFTYLAGCVSATPNIDPVISMIDVPPIGVESTAEVGESVVQKARVKQYEAYHLLSEAEASSTGYRLTLSPGAYVASKEDKNWVYYIAEDPSMVESCALGLCTETSGGFVVAKNDGEIRGFEHLNVPTKLTDSPDWRKTTYASMDTANFRQELIYNGQSGDTVRFLYREFSGDMIRPAFSQELTYDLSESAEVGFRGVRLEIRRATNVEVTYVVNKSFPDP